MEEHHQDSGTTRISTLLSGQLPDSLRMKPTNEDILASSSDDMNSASSMESLNLPSPVSSSRQLSPNLSLIISPASSALSLEDTSCRRRGLLHASDITIRDSYSPILSNQSSVSTSLSTSGCCDSSSNRKSIRPLRAPRSNSQIPGIVFKIKVESELDTELIDIIKKPEEFEAYGKPLTYLKRLDRTSNYLSLQSSSQFLATNGPIRRHRRRTNNLSLHGHNNNNNVRQQFPDTNTDEFPTSETYYNAFAQCPPIRHRRQVSAESLGFQRTYLPPLGEGGLLQSSGALCPGSDDDDQLFEEYSSHRRHHHHHHHRNRHHHHNHSYVDEFDDTNEYQQQQQQYQRRKPYSSTKKSVKKSRVVAKPRASGDKVCTSCAQTSTPIWREVKESWGEGWGEVLLCNACGLQWRMAGLRCDSCLYVPRASEKRAKKCTRCENGRWYRKS